MRTRIVGEWVLVALLGAVPAHAATFNIVVSNGFANANDVSPDGSVVVGNSAGFSCCASSFRWQNGTSTTISSDFDGPELGAGASSGGSVIVGAHEGVAYRWEAGQRVSLGTLSGDSRSWAFDVSADASTIVGYSDGAVDHAFMHQNGAMSPLGDLAGGIDSSQARSVSGDGSVIVGQGTSASGSEAFRWENGAMEGLGDLTGGGFASGALDITLDG